MAKKVVANIVAPQGFIIRTFDNRKEARAFLAGLNWSIPSWEWDKRYRIYYKVVDTEDIGTK